MFITLLTLIFFYSPSLCHAHGVSGTIGQGGIILSAEYDDGEPMSYAEITISAPDAQLPFVSGWTDRNGRFGFSPDVQGIYHATVSDEVGHKLELDLPITPDLTPVQKPTPSSKDLTMKWIKAFCGISLICFFYSALFYWKAKTILTKSKGGGFL